MIKIIASALLLLSSPAFCSESFTLTTLLELSSGKVIRGIKQNDSLAPSAHFTLKNRHGWYIQGAASQVDVVRSNDPHNQLQYGLGYVLNVSQLGSLNLSVTEYDTLNGPHYTNYDWRDYRMRWAITDNLATAVGAVENYWGSEKRSNYTEVQYAIALTPNWLLNTALGRQFSEGATGWRMAYGHVNIAYAHRSRFAAIEYRYSNNESQDALKDFAGEGWFGRLGWRF